MKIYVIVENGDGYEPTPVCGVALTMEAAQAKVRALADKLHEKLSRQHAEGLAYNAECVRGGHPEYQIPREPVPSVEALVTCWVIEEHESE